MSWDVSGSGLGTFSDGFGMVLGKMSDGVEKKIICKNGREYCSCVGLFQNIIFRLSPAKKYRNFRKCIFAVFLYINSLKGDPLLGRKLPGAAIEELEGGGKANLQHLVISLT